jgi:hypothetical protein
MALRFFSGSDEELFGEDDLQVLCQDKIEADLKAEEDALEAMSDEELLCEDYLDQLREEEIDRRLGISDDQ